MKLNEAMKIIDEGWMTRKKGYRIQFEKRVDSEWVSEVFPDESENLLNSEISAWEVARRFAQATKSDSTKFREGDIVDVTVVDDLGNPVKFYGTNQPRVLNKRETVSS